MIFSNPASRSLHQTANRLASPETNPPQVAINSSNFSHLFFGRTEVTAQKYIYFFYLKKIFFPKTPSRAFRPNFRHCSKKLNCPNLGRGCSPPRLDRTPMLLRTLHVNAVTKSLPSYFSV